MLKASLDGSTSANDATDNTDDVRKLNEIKNRLQSSLLKMTHTLEENLLYYKMTLLIFAILIFLLVINHIVAHSMKRKINSASFSNSLGLFGNFGLFAFLMFYA